MAELSTCTTVENPPGIFRTTLAYNDQAMICHFRLTKGGKIPLHNHPAVQAGYVISGKVRFLKEDESSFVAETGTSYVFESDEYHGAEVLEDSLVLECFTPMRPEYIEG